MRVFFVTKKNNQITAINAIITIREICLRGRLASPFFCLFKMPGRGHINSISVVPDLTGEWREDRHNCCNGEMEFFISPLRLFSLFNHPATLAQVWENTLCDIPEIK